MKEEKTKPNFPVLVLDKHGYIDIINSSKELTKCSLVAFLNGFYESLEAFELGGLAWKVNEAKTTHRINWFTKFLTYSFYNPKIDVQIDWKVQKNYKLDILKERLVKFIDEDDDIYTQFNDAETLRNVINNTASLSELVDNVKKYIIDGEIVKS